MQVTSRPSYSYYDTLFATPVKKILKYSVPRTGTIALISFAAGWCAVRYAIVHAPGKGAELTGELTGSTFQSIASYFGETAGKTASGVGNLLGYHVISLFWVPDALPQISQQTGVIASFATSILLNLVAQYCFGIGANKKNPLEAELVKRGFVDPKKEEKKEEEFKLPDEPLTTLEEILIPLPEEMPTPMVEPIVNQVDKPTANEPFESPTSRKLPEDAQLERWLMADNEVTIKPNNQCCILF